MSRVLTLPRSFANATVLIEQVSDTELRIRKLQVIPEHDLPLREESATLLSDRDREIVTLRFGLGGHREHTLQEVGNRYGLTKERIRQLEKRSLNRLRDELAVEELAGLLE